MNGYILDGQYEKYLEYAGIPVGEVLRQAGIPEDLFTRNTPVLDEAAYYRFMESIGTKVQNWDMLLALAASDQIETFSPPVFAAYCSKNPKKCMERLSQYKRLIAPVKYEITEEEDSLKLVIAPRNEKLVIPQFFVEVEIIFFLHIIRSATKRQIIPLKIEMQEPVTDQNFRSFVGCLVCSGSNNSLQFSMNDMQIPFISYNQSMWKVFEPGLQKRLYEMKKEDLYSEKVKSALTELLPGGSCAVDEVAAKLGISRRTLQRKLKEEGTTFQNQLSEIRKQLACHYIQNTDMRTDNIAFLLGYQEMNSFLRAFRNWTGMSVGEYKKQYSGE